jgi:hypothetical protein
MTPRIILSLLMILALGSLLTSSIATTMAQTVIPTVVTTTTPTVVTTTTPTAGQTTIVSLIYDTDANGLGGPLDMVGPTIGSVEYAQATDGSLRVQVTITFGFPNTTYQVFLVCGFIHDESCGFIAVGPVTTNGAGTGRSTSLTISAATLQDAPFGPGYRTDHIDLLQNEGDLSRGVLAAGRINYFIPGSAGSAPDRARPSSPAPGRRDPVRPGR